MVRKAKRAGVREPQRPRRSVKYAAPKKQPDAGPETKSCFQEHAAATYRLKCDLALAVVALGRRLLVVRKQLPPDAWRRWLDVSFDWSPAQAARYIRAASRFNKPAGELLDPPAMLILSDRQASRQAVTEALHETRRGRRVTARIARRLVAKDIARRRAEADG
jgi:hypothetical protein